MLHTLHACYLDFYKTVRSVFFPFCFWLLFRLIRSFLQKKKINTTCNLDNVFSAGKGKSIFFWFGLVFFIRLSLECQIEFLFCVISFLHHFGFFFLSFYFSERTKKQFIFCLHRMRQKEKKQTTTTTTRYIPLN